MLSTDEYQFEGRSSDYASRFRLVFHCTGVEEHYDNNYTGSETFAFIHDGQLVIDGTGTLQIIDMLGRVLVCRDAKSCVSTTGMTPGVYVLRLINGSNTKTQKLIINK